MSRLRAIAVSCVIGLLPVAPAQAGPPITIEAQGSVRNPGSHALPAGARLSNAALAARPDENAYMLGAALLRRQSIPSQAALKAGLLFDLEQLAKQPANAAVANHLLRQFHSMPVTGRIPQLLDPRPLEASRTLDIPAQEGDHLLYPQRPGTITVLGAVVEPCQLTHIALADAAAYARQCPRLVQASKDYIHLVQPDGSHRKLGVAAWNRDANAPLAPGAIVFVPLDEQVVRRTAPDVNEDAARFLATQVLENPGT